MLNKLISTFLLFFTFTGATHAKMSAMGSVLASTDWQKVELEYKLRGQVNDTLRGILKKDQYIVDIKLDVSEPTQPDFMLTPPPPVKEKVRFSVKTADAASADYIVFQKLGLEAPIVSEFKEIQKGQKSEFELLWKYNQSLNLFNNLNAIDIKVSIDDRLSEETINSAKKALNNTNFNFSRGLQPSITIETMSMLNELKVKPEMTWLDKLEWLSRFANMIGLILATLLAAIVSLVLFKKYADLKKEELAALANQNNKKDEKEKEEKDDTPQLSPAPNLDSEAHDEIMSGVQRFKTFFVNSPTEASILLKKWLRADDEMENQALCVLVQYLENNDLMNVFSLLSEGDRESWKKILTETKLKKNLKPIADFIGTQVVDEIIVPQKFVDDKLSDLLLSTDESQAAKFIEEDLDYGPMILNIMNVKYVSKVLGKLKPELSNEALRKSFKFDDNYLKDNIEIFKSKLINFAVQKSQNPFLDRVMQLIPMANVENETPLFTTLIDEKCFEELEVVANKFIPAEIIKNLDGVLIGELMELYTMSKKTELIASLEDKVLKDKIVASFAPDGSTAKEMLTIELENYETDLSLQKHIKEHRSDIWQQYINHCRKHLTTNPKYESAKDELVQAWIVSKKGEQITQLDDFVDAA